LLTKRLFEIKLLGLPSQASAFPVYISPDLATWHLQGAQFADPEGLRLVDPHRLNSSVDALIKICAR